MESNHNILVFHEARCHLDDLVCRLVARLRIERTKYNTTRRIILHQTVLVCLQTALGKLRVQVVGPTRSLMCWKLSRLILALDCALLQLLFLLLEILQFLFLEHVSELFPDQFKFLLIENVDVVIDVIIEPWVY